MVRKTIYLIVKIKDKRIIGRYAKYHKAYEALPEGATIYQRSFAGAKYQDCECLTDKETYQDSKYNNE